MTDSRQLAVGVDMGGTSLYAAVVDVETGELLAEKKRKTRAEEGATAVTKRLAETIKDALKEAKTGKKDIIGVGVGVPGPILAEQGVVISLTNMGPTWDGFALGERLSQDTGLSVLIENDVNVGAVGEHRFGAGQGTQDMIALFVGTGLGGGVILGGKLRNGFRGSAGEVGHMLVRAEGALCGCGERGHVEAYASRTAIQNAIMEAIDDGADSIVPKIMETQGRTMMTSSVVEEAYEAGDEVTVKAVQRAQFYLGLLVADCVNLLDPEAIVVGGGVLERMGDAYLEPVRLVAQQHYLNKQDADKIRIVPAALGDASGAVGAAILAAQRL